MTAIYNLERQEDDGKETTGWLKDGDTILAYTIERPWLNNQHDISCIPPGTYLFYSFQSPHNGDCWRTDQVPNRTAIEIHAGNTVSDVDGCIIVGDMAKDMVGYKEVFNSQKTMKMLKSKLADTFYLNVIAPNA